MLQLSTVVLLAAFIPGGMFQLDRNIIRYKPTEAPVKPLTPEIPIEPLTPGLPIEGITPLPVSTPYCWTEWFDMDDPRTWPGDYETLPALRRRYPGKICKEPQGIEALTVHGGQTPTAAGDKVTHSGWCRQDISVRSEDKADLGFGKYSQSNYDVRMDKDTGFICRTRDQKDRRCNDYKVRFLCPSPYCGEEVCWTRWFDIDNPGGKGDYELLSDLHKRYPRRICKKPKYIEAVTVHGGIPATSTGQTFVVFSPTEGFACKNSECQKCKDYKVRFGCCCPENSLPYNHT